MTSLDRSPPERLRGAVVGYGFISEHGHVPAYSRPGRTRFDIVAVADTCAARREKARAALPKARIYEDHQRLLEGERGRIDFVDVTTPPYAHAKIAHDALARGLHVLCEKPIATTSEDARAMAAHALEARRVFYPCHNYKHAPVIKLVRRMLDDDAIGSVRLVTLQTFRNTHAKGVSEWRRDWRREHQYSGGGIAMDHGSHTFYLAFEWLRGYPTAITARMSADDGFDTEDNLSCAMTFAGGTATAHLTWTAGVRKVIYTIHGARGAIRVEDDDVEMTVMDGRAGQGPPRWETKRQRVASDWSDASHAGWFRSMFDDFAAAVGREDFVSAETEASVRCIDLIAAAYRSAREQSCEQLLAGASGASSTTSGVQSRVA